MGRPSRVGGSWYRVWVECSSQSVFCKRRAGGWARPDLYRPVGILSPRTVHVGRVVMLVLGISCMKLRVPRRLRDCECLSSVFRIVQWPMIGGLGGTLVGLCAALIALWRL